MKPLNHLQKFTAQIRSHIIGVLILNNMLLIGCFWAAWQYLQDIDAIVIFSGFGILTLVTTIIWARIASKTTAEPMGYIQQAVLHVSPSTSETVTSPDITKLRLGRDLVTSLVNNIYQLGTVAEGLQKQNEASKTDLSTNFIANKLPVPMLVLSEDQTILFANENAAQYIGLDSSEKLIGQNAYTMLNMSFLSAFTLDAWLQAARKSKPTAVQTWERVKLTLNDDNHTVKLLDLAAYYNQGNPNHYETVLVLFDHTDQYSQDDQAMSFVALSVHELRTPLTLLRGYIEVLQDELPQTINPELRDFIHKMDAIAQQLTYFVNNILNVARIEQTGLELELHEEAWAPIVQSAVKDMSLRASVRGMQIQIEVADNLPTVGADRVSIYEVICNLLDNALKYSGDSKLVTLCTYINSEGLVETAVEDKGVGIPQNSMKNLFDKFYRDHHKRDTIGGTGLGLYLSKIIVGAHSGHIWVKSKEGEGSTFGFTLLPYEKLAAENKNSDNKAIVRSAHGWIKNHSLYRQ